MRAPSESRQTGDQSQQKRQHHHTRPEAAAVPVLSPPFLLPVIVDTHLGNHLISIYASGRVKASFPLPPLPVQEFAVLKHPPLSAYNTICFS